jgi:hypothetical protein
MPVPPPLPPAREWLVDGFNVLHTSFFPDGGRHEWWTARHRDRLLERIAAFAPLCAKAVGATGLTTGAKSPPEPTADDLAPSQLCRVWVVFDGERDAAEEAGGTDLRVIFASSADDWIVKRVREAAIPAQIGVVTGDRQVAGRARHRGAHIVTPSDFLAHCNSTIFPPSDLTRTPLSK